jgi:uncharacterized protein YjaZ
MTSLNIFFVQTNPGIPKALQESWQATIEHHGKEAMRILHIDGNLTVSVYPNGDWAVPETGAGGYAPTGDWIQLSLDPAKEKKEDVERTLPATVYHECNHIARWRTVGYGKTLLEAMITEGLACVFEKQFGKISLPWTVYSPEEIATMLDVVRMHGSKEGSYEHPRWFFGTDPLVPRWLGYKVGTYIVEQALLHHSSASIVDLTTEKAERILEHSGVKLWG